MSAPDLPPPQPLRKRLLILEFSCLAVLLLTMGWFSSQKADATPLNPAWLIVPALASLGVFLSFIGLMYLRWVATAEASNRFRQKLVFSLLALTLIGVWIYGIANTWLSLTTS